jgi:mRNA interferase HigB
VRIITLRTLKKFWQEKPEAEKAIRAWHAEVKAANWQRPADIKAQYRSASIFQNSRVVFNICGNKYRLIVHINYKISIIYIRFIGTHKEYDAINAEEI